MNSTTKESAAVATQSQIQEDYSVTEKILQALKGSSKIEPVPGKDLAWAVGLDDRGLRDHIEAMRRDGISTGDEICSDSQGYWFAQDDKDLERFLIAYEAHAKTRFHISHQMRKRWQQKKDKERLERFMEEYDSDPDNV